MALDFSPLNAPVPENGMARGQTFFANALDAVLQRRAAMQAEKQQREQAEAHFQANLAFQKNQAEVQEAARLRDDERANQIAKAQAEQQRLERERQDRIQQGSTIKDVAGMMKDEDQRAAIRPFLQTQNIRAAPIEVDPTLRQPIQQPPPLPELPPGLEHDQGSMWSPEREPGSPEQLAIQEAAAREQARVQKLAAAEEAASKGIRLHFPNGGTSDLDLFSSSPAGKAERLRRIIPLLDPPDALEAQRALVLLEGGAVDAKGAGAAIQAGKSARESMERARLTAQNRQGMSGGEQARIGEQHLSSARSAYGGWAEHANVPALTKKYQTVRDLNRQVDEVMNLAPGESAVIAQREVLFNIAKTLSGPGVLTKEDIDATVRNTSGVIASALSKVQGAVSGELGPEEWKALEKYVRNAQRLVHRTSIEAVDSFDTRFNKSTSYMRHTPEEVASFRETLKRDLNVSDEELEKFRAKRRAVEAADALISNPAAKKKGGKAK